ncbi:MAG: FadR family transcriptional regulator [Planctomycetaceae bacterium]|nr:FadR family transcriptional regulator [Planctomycetaceae bacterium]
MSIPVSTIPSEQGASRSINLLCEFITERKLKPGDRLPSIRDLATQFGVKAGVIRDAMLDAQGKGIVKVLPRAGAFVESIDNLSARSTTAQRLGTRVRDTLSSQSNNLFHLLDARETLETAMIAEAARRREIEDLYSLRHILEEMASTPQKQRGEKYAELDVEFHLEIARLSGNAVMAAMLCAVMEELTPYLKKIRWSSKRHTETDKSHSRLYAALVAGDMEAAQDETRNHLQHAYASLLDQVRQPPKVGRTA